jgi:hypothetical protein
MQPLPLIKHNIAIAGEYQRILSVTTGFPVEGEGRRSFCSLDDGVGVFGSFGSGDPARRP